MMARAASQNYISFDFKLKKEALLVRGARNFMMKMKNKHFNLKIFCAGKYSWYESKFPRTNINFNSVQICPWKNSDRNNNFSFNKKAI